MNNNNGYCECGCGKLASIIKSSNKSKGYIVGESYKFLRGHGSLGKILPKETLDKMSKANLGKTLSEDHKRKISESRLGEKNPNWKGGITLESRAARRTPKYKEWVRQVFERDDYTCQRCKTRGGDLEAHHIKFWFLFIELRYVVSNGMTLCEKCHYLEHTGEGHWRSQHWKELRV